MSISTDTKINLETITQSFSLPSIETFQLYLNGKEYQMKLRILDKDFWREM